MGRAEAFQSTLWISHREIELLLKTIDARDWWTNWKGALFKKQDLKDDRTSWDEKDRIKGKRDVWIGFLSIWDEEWRDG